MLFILIIGHFSLSEPESEIFADTDYSFGSDEIFAESEYSDNDVIKEEEGRI